MELIETGCCAVLEMKDISTLAGPTEILDFLKGNLPLHTRDFQRKKPFITFSGVVQRSIPDHASGRRDDYARELADFILQNGLGEVVKDIPTARNWTGNVMKMYIWLPNYNALQAFWATQQQTTIEL
jgi:hypothetical protein